MQSQPPTLLCSYSYDPLDRLTSHTLPESAERQRFYCKNRLTTEIQGAIKHSIVQHDDLLLAQHRVEDKVLDTTLLATDQQRSVLRTLKADHLPHPIAYSPYGHRDPENGLLSLLGFNGERPDPVTGHYLLGNGYRAFNPVLMRFNSSDSLSPFGKGGLNSYAYCLGDPINLYDPNGSFVIALNLLPKAVNRFAKYLSKRINPIKRNKPRKQSFKIEEKVDYKDYPDEGFWTENIHVTTTNKANGETTSHLRFVKGHSDTTTVSQQGKSRTYKNELNLRELSYSNIPGAQLNNAIHQPHFKIISPEIDLLNLENHRNPFYSDRSMDNLTREMEIRKHVRRITDEKALQGKLNGVRSSKVVDEIRGS